MVSALYMTIRAWTESRLQMYPHTDAQQGMGKEEGPGLGGLLSAILQACQKAVAGQRENTSQVRVLLGACSSVCGQCSGHAVSGSPGSRLAGMHGQQRHKGTHMGTGVRQMVGTQTQPSCYGFA